MRQTCRLRVKINGGAPTDVVLRFAHQDPEGQNSRPVGENVHLNGTWNKSKDVEVLELLPWIG